MPSHGSACSACCSTSNTGPVVCDADPCVGEPSGVCAFFAPAVADEDVDLLVTGGPAAWTALCLTVPG
jgi:hypothetical protein